MNKKSTYARTQNIILTGVLVCMGLIIPYFTGHAIGVSGKVLLPMHISVLMAGFLVGLKYGAVCGFLTPILSSMLTGMPVFWPTLPMMICELTTYGAVIGLLRKKYKMPIYVSLIGAMIAGRIVNGIAFAIIMLPESVNAVLESSIASIVAGIPGIIIQLTFIPVVVKLVENRIGAASDLREVSDVSKVVTEALREIKSGRSSCILIKDEKIIHKASGRGVTPLIELLESDEGRIKLKESIVVDKIIGKATAMLLVLGNASSAYGVTMSVSGKDYLAQRDIEFNFERCVDVISDKEGRGICPIERSILEIDEAEQGYKRIVETTQQLMKKTS